MAFRRGPAGAEPFGVWLLWLRFAGHFAVVDFQNGGVAATLRGGVALLAWPEAPRDECFWAPFRGAGGGKAPDGATPGLLDQIQR